MQIGADPGFKAGGRNSCGHGVVLLTQLYGGLPYISTTLSVRFFPFSETMLAAATKRGQMARNSGGQSHSD
jgi:hypothetical protein